MALFQVADGRSKADLEVIIEGVPELNSCPGERLFDSGSLWTLYRTSGGSVYDFCTPVLGPLPYKRLFVADDFSVAKLWANQQCIRGRKAYALEYPVDELLVTQWLARGRGIEVHGCGLIDPEIGPCLFVGHSGAGKSTTSRLWRQRTDVQVLSDDRIILRKHNDEFWMYGTPWHGEAGFAAPGRARVRRIFFLEHGQENGIAPMPVVEATGELFARSFVPFHDGDLLHSSLSFLQSVANSIPCYWFNFCPDQSAVTAILNLYG
jgi:hypothetical protein